jgi:hypothetical protein
MELTIMFAVLAGIGGGLAWGYRTALNVALGRTDATTPPREPNIAALPVGGQRDRAEYTR